VCGFMVENLVIRSRVVNFHSNANIRQMVNGDGRASGRRPKRVEGFVTIRDRVGRPLRGTVPLGSPSTSRGYTQAREAMVTKMLDLRTPRIVKMSTLRSS
jgi:hypothetical protein